MRSTLLFGGGALMAMAGVLMLYGPLF